MQTKLESMPSPTPKKGIDLSSALRSSLRAWLAARDSAIWLFVQGSVEGDVPALEELDLDALTRDLTPLVSTLNSLRSLAYHFARDLSPYSTEAAVRIELQALLAEESPKFLLRVDGVPSAF